MCWTRITLYLTSASSSQLDCCGPTGTVIDAAKDICPKKEGLEVLITKSCPNAIDEMFNNRLHIIGGVGIGIGVIMVSL
ncbi:CD9 antigen-like, partial [Seriola lalandi dorsalis]|uniref:CD9 antigen-like n=1 Tax=Seriola lalandi dorsalis TaxID=1841481 RepID=UPI000C6F707D